MEKEEFRKHGHRMVDWMADYLEGVENYPVKPDIAPGDILKKLESEPPNSPQPFEDIFEDFQKTIMPGMTHWQHPSFFGYFPASRSEPSILAEMLTSTLGAQCMMWVTSPAAAELEEKMMEWLKNMLNLPQDWKGSIQDTASTATLCALLTAREVATDFKTNEEGISNNKFRVYCSSEAHSSVEKAAMMAGLGRQNVHKIEVDAEFAMKNDVLGKTILRDKQDGLIPLCVVGALGTTGSTAIDPIDAIAEITQKHGIWYHIDAAYAGSAFVIDDFRDRFKSLDLADSFVFNPHKWMFTNFDCSVYYVKNADHLVNTFSLTPEYLRTREESEVNNYKDWGVQLGRRFRALKLWFVIRSMGVEGIREKISKHISLGQWFAKQVQESEDFELLAPVPLNTVCFRFNPGKLGKEETDSINESIMHKLNDSGKLFLTHTRLTGKIALRLVPGQTEVQKRHVEKAWALINEVAFELLHKHNS